MAASASNGSSKGDNNATPRAANSRLRKKEKVVPVTITQSDSVISLESLLHDSTQQIKSNCNDTEATECTSTAEASVASNRSANSTTIKSPQRRNHQKTRKPSVRVRPKRTDRVIPCDATSTGSTTTAETANTSATKNYLVSVEPLMETVYFENCPLLLTFTIVALSNVMGLLWSLVYHNSQRHLDLFAIGIAFSLATFPALIAPETIGRVKLSSGCILIWALRLTAYSLQRNLIHVQDGRRSALLSTRTGTCQYWLLCLVWGWCCLLPHALGATSTGHGSTLCVRLGFLVFCAGFVLETIADYQKFVQHAEEPHMPCMIGLWSYAQQPNYTGEILLWIGIYLMNVTALVQGIDMDGRSSEGASSSCGAGSYTSRRMRYSTSRSAIHGLISSLFYGVQCAIASWRVVIALAGPLFVGVFLYGQAVGRFGNSLELRLAKYIYGQDLVYTAYIDTVPILMPTTPEQWERLPFDGSVLDLEQVEPKHKTRHESDNVDAYIEQLFGSTAEQDKKNNDNVKGYDYYYNQLQEQKKKTASSSSTSAREPTRVWVANQLQPSFERAYESYYDNGHYQEPTRIWIKEQLQPSFNVAYEKYDPPVQTAGEFLVSTLQPQHRFAYETYTTSGQPKTKKDMAWRKDSELKEKQMKGRRRRRRRDRESEEKLKQAATKAGEWELEAAAKEQNQPTSAPHTARRGFWLPPPPTKVLLDKTRPAMERLAELRRLLQEEKVQKAASVI